jgi:putative membrane protein
MFWWWGPGWGWIAGLISAVLWIAIIVGAIVLLRRELPHLQHRFSTPPALRLLEERYARGEITREDFLHRREVLLSPPAPPPPPDPSQHGGGAMSTYEPPPPAEEPQTGAETTQPLPPEPPG